MKIAHNTTSTLKCRCNGGIQLFPVWYLNDSEIPVVSAQGYTTKIDHNTQDLIGILTIDGNETHGIMTVSCRVEGQTVYTERLNVEGL